MEPQNEEIWWRFFSKINYKVVAIGLLVWVWPGAGIGVAMPYITELTNIAGKRQRPADRHTTHTPHSRNVETTLDENGESSFERKRRFRKQLRIQKHLEAFEERSKKLDQVNFSACYHFSFQSGSHSNPFPAFSGRKS